LGPSLPCTPAAFEPNRILRVTPQFLEQAIAQIRQSGFEIISLDDAHFRLLEKDFRRSPA
jgi:peptidoglycan/xylan/chitin deacetylase (PgdA/CDA1 family)